MHGHKFGKALQTFEEARRASLDAEAERGAERAWRAITLPPSPTTLPSGALCSRTPTRTLPRLTRLRASYHKRRGDLGDDRSLTTKHGEAAFATGDRIQFTGNGYGQTAKRAGLVNGRVGTVAGIEGASGGRTRLTVELDGKKGAEPKRFLSSSAATRSGGNSTPSSMATPGPCIAGRATRSTRPLSPITEDMRSASAYVALTRHREGVHLYAARETVKDLGAVAKGFERSENKRAATAYHIDRAELASVEEALAAAERSPGGEAETRQESKVRAFLEQEEAERAARSQGRAPDKLSPEQQAAEKAKQRDRDRGGGQSL